MAENVFFTSDEHFGHANVIKFCNRPFASTDDMREELIKRHNEVVKKGDLVYHLGDMFWRTTGPSEAEEILNRLNGQKFYIWGNHEEVIRKNKHLQDKFIWTKDYAKIHPLGKTKIILSHYAHRVWEGSHRGDYHLYGHSHGQLPEVDAGSTKDESPLCFDVGIDCWNYYPVSIDQVVEKMKSKEALLKS